MLSTITSGSGGPADQYFVLADFRSYMDAHSRIRNLEGVATDGQGCTLTNIAKSGIFSADRSVSEYWI